MGSVNAGDRFGDLIVLETRSGRRRSGQRTRGIAVLCECRCGNTIWIPASRLLKPHHRNCGCDKQVCGPSQWRINSYGYRQKRIDGKAVLEHRLVMELSLGRKLGRHEAVHHINGIKTDNRSCNLAVLNHSEHSKTYRELLRELARLIKENTLLREQLAASNNSIHEN